MDANKEIRLICETEILPNIQNLTSPQQPSSEMVLPSSVLAKAPKYLQRSLLQANCCYEQRWFDASSVMIRKLVENLIIEVYEKHGKQAEIQKDGDYLMLSGLVTAMLNFRDVFGPPAWAPVLNNLVVIATGLLFLGASGPGDLTPATIEPWQVWLLGIGTSLLLRGRSTSRAAKKAAKRAAKEAASTA